MAKQTKEKSDTKILISAIKKTVKSSVLSILEDVFLNKDKIIFGDLETFVSIPYKSGISACVPASLFTKCLNMMTSPEITAKDLAISFKDGNKVIKMTGDDVANYPISPIIMGAKSTKIGIFTKQDIDNLNIAAVFCSTDDLRPAMTGVYIHKNIVATDAHRLFWKPMATPVSDNNAFIIPANTINIMKTIGADSWTINKENTKDAARICLTSETGIQVEFRPIDSRFPDYEVVIPSDVPRIKIFADPDKLLEELKNAGEFSNKSTGQVVLAVGNELTFSSQDVDFGFEYKNGYKNGDFFEWAYNKEKQLMYNGDVVKIVKDMGDTKVIARACYGDITVKSEELTPEQDFLETAYNYKLLSEIIHKAEYGPIEIHLWAPKKAAVINGQFLLMPLMLG